jgi:hypothetical protein
MRMRRIRGVWSTNTAAFLLGAGMYASFIVIPQFAQLPRSTGFGFGLYLLPSTVGMFLLGLSQDASRLASARRRCSSWAPRSPHRPSRSSPPSTPTRSRCSSRRACVLVPDRSPAGRPAAAAPSSTAEEAAAGQAASRKNAGLRSRGLASARSIHSCRSLRRAMAGAGFEPAKAEPADLQSAPFDRSGTPPKGSSIAIRSRRPTRAPAPLELEFGVLRPTDNQTLQLWLPSRVHTPTSPREARSEPSTTPRAAAARRAGSAAFSACGSRSGARARG